MKDAKAKALWNKNCGYRFGNPIRKGMPKDETGLEEERQRLLRSWSLKNELPEDEIDQQYYRDLYDDHVMLSGVGHIYKCPAEYYNPNPSVIGTRGTANPNRLLMKRKVRIHFINKSNVCHQYCRLHLLTLLSSL